MDTRTGELKDLSEIDARDVRSGAFVPVDESKLTEQEKEEKYVPKERRSEVMVLASAKRHVKRKALRLAKKLHRQGKLNS